MIRRLIDWFTNQPGRLDREVWPVTGPAPLPDAAAELALYEAADAISAAATRAGWDLP
jgi:hypothetical protein